MSYTISQAKTFTITHARQIAAKVAADLGLCAAYYGQPSQGSIPHYLEELALLLSDGYIQEYEFGFKKNGARILCWRYRVNLFGDLNGGNDRPGGLVPRFNIDGADYYNITTPSAKWLALNSREQEMVEQTLPFRRSSGTLPSDGTGYWATDRTYSAGGVSIGRSAFRPF